MPSSATVLNNSTFSHDLILDSTSILVELKMFYLRPGTGTISQIIPERTVFLLWLTSNLRHLLKFWGHYFCDFSLKSGLNAGNVIFPHITRKRQIIKEKQSQSLPYLLMMMAAFVCLKTLSTSPLFLWLLINSQSTILTEQSCSPRLNKDEMIISSSVFLPAIKRDEMGSALGSNSQGVVEEKCLRATPLDLILGELSLRKPCWLVIWESTDYQQFSNKDNFNHLSAGECYSWNHQALWSVQVKNETILTRHY